jgi:hypothetical protein
MALTRVDKGMLKGDAMDGIGPDHVQLEANPCGIIMELKLDDKFSATAAKVCATAAKGCGQLALAAGSPTPPLNTGFGASLAWLPHVGVVCLEYKPDNVCWLSFYI